MDADTGFPPTRENRRHFVFLGTVVRARRYRRAIHNSPALLRVEVSGREGTQDAGVEEKRLFLIREEHVHGYTRGEALAPARLAGTPCAVLDGQRHFRLIHRGDGEDGNEGGDAAPRRRRTRRKTPCGCGCDGGSVEAQINGRCGRGHADPKIRVRKTGCRPCGHRGGP